MIGNSIRLFDCCTASHSPRLYVSHCFGSFAAHRKLTTTRRDPCQFPAHFPSSSRQPSLLRFDPFRTNFPALSRRAKRINNFISFPFISRLFIANGFMGCSLPIFSPLSLCAAASVPSVSIVYQHLPYLSCNGTCVLPVSASPPGRPCALCQRISQ